MVYREEEYDTKIVTATDRTQVKKINDCQTVFSLFERL